MARVQGELGKPGMVEFRILGPLEVSSDGGSAPLGGGRQRAVLVLLLLRLGEVVATEQMLEELWAGRPPATATKVVQLYVSRLRKGLGDGVILTRSPGYVLRVDPGRLDSRRFERLFDEGRRALAGGSPEPAAVALRDALSLWRGPALADLRYEPFAQGEIARLEELRSACLEERIEADLALGTHAELVGELEALVGAHPMRERLRGQLMLALYRSGRQAEALAAYQAARQALVEGLGIEPGPALQRLERAILNQAPALELPSVASPPVAVPVAEATPEPEPARRFEGPQERKVATAVFVDLVGSTELGEGDPERTRVMLERFYDAMATEIEAVGGTVEKLTGDTIMAIFGAPAAQEDHAERALHAALAMRDRLAELFRGELALHVGVETGEVVVARPRQGSSFATGNAVNVAARLEQAAAPGEIFVGERTVAAARGAFAFDEPLLVEVQGTRVGIACRKLLRELARERPRGVGDLPGTFVGRESELELLRATYRRAAREGQPHLLTIMGEAGVGKTALMRELWGELHEEAPAVQPLTGRCLAYGRGITYWPLGEILKQHLGLREGDPLETVLERLGDRPILGLTLGLDVAGELHPLEAREALHSAWVELLGELAAERPCVVLIEDLHWAEEPLLDLFERLLRDVQGTVLLLGTARPELLGRRPAWAGGRRNAASLWLEPLSQDETAELVEALLGTELAPSLSELVLGRAEGNPFFVEELLATLIDTGVIARENGGWVIRELAADQLVPDSIQATLASRIDLLPAREKAALQAASVAGRVFWASPVAELVGEEPDYALLEERDFIRQQRVSSLVGEREFWIKHALTREVAYASLPKARRARLHAAFAAWIERAGGGRDEHAPFLAHHYAEAVRPEDADFVWAGEGEEHTVLRNKARTWLRRAAELAIGRYEMRDAAELLARAVALEPDRQAQVELWQEIARASALYFDSTRFASAMEQAIALEDGNAATADLYAELAFQAMARAGMWGVPPPGDLVGGWIESALERAEPASSARAKALIARIYSVYDKSPSDAEEASRIAADLGDPVLDSLGLDARAVVAFVRGEYREALAWCRRRFALADELGDPETEAYACASAVSPAVACGEFDEARMYAARHAEVTGRLSPHHRLHGAAVLVQLEELLGNWAAVLELQPLVQARVEENLATPCVMNARSLFVCALAHAYLGDEGEALRLEQMADRLAMTGYGTVLDTPRLRLALHRNQPAAVQSLLGEPAVRTSNWFYLSAMAAHLDGLAALDARERVEEEARRASRPGTYLEPFALRALGVVREDERLMGEAVDRFESFGLAWHAAQTRSVLESV